MGFKALENLIRHVSNQKLDLDVAELSCDVGFLERQVQADPQSYTSEELSLALRKIAISKKRLKILKKEVARRRGNQSN